jgi:hypothetical protein
MIGRLDATLAGDKEYHVTLWHCNAADHPPVHVCLLSSSLLLSSLVYKYTTYTETVYGVYLVIHDSGQATPRHLLVLCDLPRTTRRYTFVVYHQVYKYTTFPTTLYVVYLVIYDSV